MVIKVICYLEWMKIRDPMYKTNGSLKELPNYLTGNYFPLWCSNTYRQLAYKRFHPELVGLQNYSWGWQYSQSLLACPEYSQLLGIHLTPFHQIPL